MKSRLFGQRQRKLELAARTVPAGTRVYAIGDIHGSLVPLRLLRDAIREHAAAHPIERKCLIYLGDYVDRGYDSRAVVDLLVNDPLPGFEEVFLKGNHEDGMLRFLADGSNATFWVAYGGIATMFSYGVKPPDPATDEEEVIRARKELAQKLPPAHLDFLAKLEPYHIEGDYLFVHAGIRPGLPLASVIRADSSAVRTPRSFAARIRFGQSSLSTNRAVDGSQ